jgi:hypothetical protein
MTDLFRYAAELAGAAGDKRLPPVERWNPAYCGELDLVIRRDGVWVHEGTPIGRAALVRLFSTVLKREGERYFLVTPVEKLGIRVEDAPFLAVLMRKEGEGAARKLVFTTNVGDDIVAGAENVIEYRRGVDGRGAPYLHVRAGLWARIARAVFYDLVALGETREEGGAAAFGVRSDGAFFSFGAAADVFETE